MTTENQDGGTSQNADEQDLNKNAGTDEHAAEVAKLVKERDDWKGKARKYEQAAKSAETWEQQVQTLTVEKSALHTKFTSLQNQVRDESVNSHLTTALEAAGARNVTGAMKLVDRSKVVFGDDGNVKVDSVASMITELKAAEPWAFKEEGEPDPKKGNSGTTTGQKPPSVKDAAATATNGAFETELRACTSSKEVDAVMKKYGK